MTSTHTHPSPQGAGGDQSNNSSTQEVSREVSLARFLEALEHIKHELPSQQPLDFFVHHNPLHAFEELPFCEAVEVAAERWGAQPWLPEERYREAHREARVLDRDLTATLAAELPNDREVVLGVGLREAARRLMLSLPTPPPPAPMRWAIEEGEVLRAWVEGLPRGAREQLRAEGSAPKVLSALWRVAETLSEGCAPTHRPKGLHAESKRWRRSVERAGGDNTDLAVHPLLIKYVSAYLDVSFAPEGMPSRERGLLTCALSMISDTPSQARPWLESLQRRLAQRSGPVEAHTLLEEALARLNITQGDLEPLLWGIIEALPGWPGMIAVLEARPDLSPAPLPPLSLLDFITLRLLLEESATRHTLSLSDEEPLPPPLAHEPNPEQLKLERAWKLFYTAQLLGLTATQLEQHSQALEGLLQELNSVKRRRLWHLAFERRYRVDALDAFWGRQALSARFKPATPWLKLVTCIDDREESLRRQLEELDEGVETFGYAGFYGVAMFYQPLGAPIARPLCPAVMIPERLVRELPLEGQERAARSRARRRSLLGRLRAHDYTGGRAPFRGTLSSFAGLLSAVPMAYRLLSPKQSSRLHTWTEPYVESRLALERPSDQEGPLSAEARPHGTEGAQALYLGFSLEERVQIVAQTLNDMGLLALAGSGGQAKHELSTPLIMFLGHGSRSINNPYEAGYQCGACGGGHGGANGRAFAQMANEPAVREALKERGLLIKPEVSFVGGAHDTCDDSVTLYDLTLVRASLEARLSASELSAQAQREALKRFDDHLAQAQRLIDEARAYNALERARRFELASLEMSPQEALRHVEHRSHDLSEPRPEYNHATNAMQIVAPREMTRGLFLDRRAFLTSYDYRLDPEGEALIRLLRAAVPVGAGINLEYFFSMVDPKRYGCGSKLPQNITGHLGVMDGHQSDLRTGLVWQMVEIHEPMRLLNIIVAPERAVGKVLEALPQVRLLVEKGWVQVALYDPEREQLLCFEGGAFVPYLPERLTLPVVTRSHEHVSGRRDNLPFALVMGRASLDEPTHHLTTQELTTQEVTL